MEHKRGNWGSNFGFLMAAVGSAVGLGNLWGFPYKMGFNGGFAFLVVYLLLVLFVGFMVMVGELALGRKSGLGVVGTYKKLSKEVRWLGWLGIASAFLIMSFYTVLGGYVTKYIVVNLGDIFGASWGSGGIAAGDLFNGLLTNLYRCVREKPDLLMGSLRYVLNAREDFDRARLALRRKRTTSVQRAAWFYQIIRQSYASALTSFGNQPHDLWADFPLIEQAHRRLARVVIENKDFEKLIRHYDRPESLFYCDPPYHCTEGYYSNIGEDGFTEKDHIRLRDALMSIQGKFLLSYNDDPFIRELYDAPGIQIEPVTRLNNIRQRYDPNCQFAELFIEAMSKLDK